MSEVIFNHLRQKVGYREDLALAASKQLARHPEIEAELERVILTGRAPTSAYTVVAFGKHFTAEALMKQYPLDLFEAYNYLAFLQEAPEEAVKLLDRGLPIKDKTS